ncbi:MAG TPA: ATP-binding protein [Anaerolineaceae bacterium]|nr:ATP-binding protein [Longilinea sp.]NMD31998.1 ATP-binding protein [Chloroflexota bacterium]HOU43853.1 ATP-binding protein [Anaerolineaceae bacterium]HPA32783.1 ATP-binding protein [Anaerolineaceae bacterium]HQF44206.1 ATP-binding protein [Anaerolineaceae bacterium]
MRELSLHLLDIAENSVAAGASWIQIVVDESIVQDRLYISVRDNGKGMDAETIQKVLDPFYTSRTTRKVGLGLPLLKAAAESCNGYLTIQSTPGIGTCVEIEFQHSHIDRMPLGDLASTLLTLVISAPQIHWECQYQVDSQTFLFDNQPIMQELEGIPLTDPAVLSFLRQLIEEGIQNIQPLPSGISK